MVTGANSGIGKAAAAALAKMGAHVVMVARSRERGASAQEEIKRESGNEQIDLLLADLSVQDDIHKLAEVFRSHYDRLDVLVNNAGVFMMQREETVDGLEVTFAVNHLGYFLLTNLLLDMLKESAPARIINVSSGAHYGAKMDFDDLQAEQSFAGFRAYGQSKLANVLFTRELAERLEGTDVTVNAVHPGFVASNFAKNNGFFARIGMKLIGSLFGRSPEKGAETVVYLVSSADVEGVSGKYFEDKQVKKPAAAAMDEAAARRLWQVSEELTGLEVTP